MRWRLALPLESSINTKRAISRPMITSPPTEPPTAAPMTTPLLPGVDVDVAELFVDVGLCEVDCGVA